MKKTEHIDRTPTVLFVCTDTSIFAGSSRSLMNMIKAMQGLIKPIILFPQDGAVPAIFRQSKIETIQHSFYNICARGEDRPIDFVLHPKNTLLYKRLHDDVSCAKYVKRILNGRKIDIVHSNTSVVTVGITLTKILKAKHVWHIREFIDLDFNEKPFMGKNMMRHIINTADHRICISQAVKDNWRLTSTNTEVVYNAVVPDMCFDLREKKDRYILFCSAAITPNKGSYVAVEAFFKSNVWHNGYVLKLVGHCSDNERGQIETIATKYTDDKSLIHFEGYQNNMHEYFANASAFLMCSQNEALGRVTVEAMYYGCPVIAKATGGTPEFVKDKKTGYLFSTVDECGELIQKVVATDQAPIIQEAQQTVKNNFTSSIYRGKILRIYKQILCQ